MEPLLRTLTPTGWRKSPLETQQVIDEKQATQSEPLCLQAGASLPWRLSELVTRSKREQKRCVVRLWASAWPSWSAPSRAGRQPSQYRYEACCGMMCMLCCAACCVVRLGDRAAKLVRNQVKHARCTILRVCVVNLRLHASHTIFVSRCLPELLHHPRIECITGAVCGADQKFHVFFYMCRVMMQHFLNVSSHLSCVL